MAGKKRLLISVLTCASILALILDSKTGIASALDGLDLCLRTVIPALFPFFIMSGLLTNALQGASFYIPRRIRAFLGLPRGGESLLMIGILGGYPVGAISIAQQHRNKCIADVDAQRMLGYCVNAGPAFIFGICGVLFSHRLVPWLVWLIHILSALLSATILGNKNDSRIYCVTDHAPSVADTLRSSVQNMALVCGWIIMARVMIGFLDRWVLWLMPSDLRVLLLGVFELTNGCTELANIPSEELRFLLCNAMLSFGGISVYMQVCSVTRGLGTGMYLQGKLMQCAISTVLAYIAQYFLYTPGLAIDTAGIAALVVSTVLTALIPCSSFYKKNGSFSVKNHI